MLTQLDSFISPQTSRKQVSQSMGELRASNSNSRELNFADSLKQASNSRTDSKDILTKKNVNQSNSVTKDSPSKSITGSDNATSENNAVRGQEQKSVTNNPVDRQSDDKAVNGGPDSGNELPSTVDDAFNIENTLPANQELAVAPSSVNVVDVTISGQDVIDNQHNINTQEFVYVEPVAVEALSKQDSKILSVKSELIDSVEAVAIQDSSTYLGLHNGENTSSIISENEGLLNLDEVDYDTLDVSNDDVAEELIDSIILSLSDEKNIQPTADDVVSLDEKLKQIVQLANNGQIKTSMLNDLVPESSNEDGVDVSVTDESGSVNLSWILGEMSKQTTDSMRLDKGSIKVGQGDVLNTQGIISTSLDSVDQGASVTDLDIESQLDSDNSLFIASLKSDAKVETLLSNEFKLSSEKKLPQPDILTSIDEFVVAETADADNDFLKKSMLIETELDSLQTSTLDSKILTPLSTTSGSTAFTVTSQGAQVVPQSSLTMTVPPSDPNWPQEMQEKVRWLMKEGVQTAEIHLDPPELGSLTVKVSLDSDGASVSFSAATPQARDLLESQIQRLRELLAQQGVDLSKVDVNVSQGQHQNQDTGSDSKLANSSDLGAELDDAEDVNTSYINATGVDFYA